MPCRSLDIKEVRFESDSAQLIKAIISKKPNLEIYGIVSDILRMANDFETAVFSWIPLLKNCDADILAKSALLLYEQAVDGDNLIPPPN